MTRPSTRDLRALDRGTGATGAGRPTAGDTGTVVGVVSTVVTIRRHVG